ncbi:MAG: IS66 family transposase [Actinobacteria bacterium]|nr:IS66 family transposase [Actinomycetota bacterium]
MLSENAQLRAALRQAVSRIGELEARLGMTSKNSSKPPSSDGLTKPAPKSLREKSKRGPGRPKGQKGITLEQVADPDHRETHEPRACCGCGVGLGGAAWAGEERRQVFDLPVLRLLVTEHRLVSRVCACGVITKAEAPAGVSAPVQYGSRLGGIGVYLLHGQFLSQSRTVQSLGDLFGARIAGNTLVSWTKRIAGQVVAKVVPVIGDRIAGSTVAHFDETGLRTAGKLHWMHSASTSTDVLLTVHAKRGVKGMDAAGVLPRFTGVAVHDAWAPYDTYTKATHALCNAHALRELVYVVDTAPEPVKVLATQAIDALVEIKDLVAETTARATPSRSADHPSLHALTERKAEQTHLLRSALVLGKNATAGRATKLEAKYNTLFTRMITRWEDYQRFTHDPAVPFDNNPAEQTIRMPKLRVKVSGCLRTLSGAEEFAAIRSYTATAVRQGQNMLDVLINAANGHPWIPAT